MVNDSARWRGLRRRLNRPPRYCTEAVPSNRGGVVVVGGLALAGTGPVACTSAKIAYANPLTIVTDALIANAQAARLIGPCACGIGVRSVRRARA